MTLIRLLLTQNLPKGEQSSLSVQECPSALTAAFEALLFHSFVFTLFFFFVAIILFIILMWKKPLFKVTLSARTLV